MGRRLAVYKTIAQRRAEYVIGAGLGLIAAFVVGMVTPIPRPLLPTVILVVLLLVTLINSWRLAKMGAPKLPSGEIDQRLWSEIAARSAVLTISEWMAGFTLLLAGMFILVYGMAALDAEMLPLYAVLPVAGFFAGWNRVRMARAKAKATPAAPGPVLGPHLVRLYVTLALCLAAGVGVSFYLPVQWRLYAVMGGMLIGFFALPARRALSLQPQWDKLGSGRGFLRAIGTGVALWGVPMAFFFMALQATESTMLLKLAPVELALLVGATVAIAVVGGLLFGALMWLFAQVAYWSGGQRSAADNSEARESKDQPPK